MFKVFFISVFVIFFVFTAKSQYQEMKFIDVLDRKHLTSSFVSCITQDSTGFIWIGTSQGLNRYDGYSARPYLNVEGDSLSLVNNGVTDLFIDNKGTLWVGTNNGLCVYNKYSDNFTTLSKDGKEKGLDFSAITKIKNGSDDNIFIAAGNSIFKYRKETEDFSQFISVKGGDIVDFVFDRGSVWIGVADLGLYQYSNDGKLLNFYNEEAGLASNKILDLQLIDNSLWLATYGGGVNVLNTDNGLFKYHFRDDGDNKYVTNIYIDNNKRVWVIDITGLKLYDKKLNQFYSYYHVENNKFSLKQSINNIFHDKQGNYWTTHLQGGVGLRVAPRGFEAYNKFSNQLSLSENNVSAVCSDSKGNFWVGFNTGGVNVLNLKKNKVIAYYHKNNVPSSLNNNGVQTIFKDRNGKMWLATYNGGLQYFDEKTERFKSFDHNPVDTSTIAINDIRDIVEDESGNLWLAVHGKGVDRFNIATKKVTHYTVDNNNLANEWTMSLLFDRDETLWVGTTWGLSKLEKGQTTFETYRKAEGIEQSLSSNWVNCVHQDKKGQIWVGTSAGLCKYSDRENSFERIHAPFKSNYIAGIQSDLNNNLWISTISGLNLYNPENGTWYSFDESDGLSSSEFYPNSFYTVSDDCLLFGGTEGLDVVRPQKLFLNKKPPEVVFTDFKLFYESVAQYHEDSPIKTNITYAKEVVLDYRQNIIGFEFVALNMNQSFKNEYAYRMVGFDKDWVYSGNKNTATYTNLSPGKYVFRVKACNNDKVWNEKGAFIEITIHPPWWRTWWAIAIFSLSFLVAIYAVYLIRVRNLNIQRKTLQKQVAEKTQKLSTQNILLEEQSDDLNNINTKLEESYQSLEEQAIKLNDTVLELEKSNATKDKLFSIISHDLRSPLNGVLVFLDLFYRKFSTYDEERRLYMINEIRKSLKQAYNLLENLLTWAKSQTNDISFKPVELYPDQLLYMVLAIFDTQLKKKKIALKISLEQDIKVLADREMMNVVFRNLISNAIKFTDIGKPITIRSEKVQDHAVISIIDSGIGMSEDVLNRIFKVSNKKVQKGTQGEGGSGLGLILCKEFLQKNNGTIEVESQPGKGSTFIVKLPLLIE